ncbi:AT hook-like [Trema orientale]|uniref:AT hook-like n=1 Tax=Trema orientale TaxID=63057 RepID=A0A2P5FLW7_TREOI|nr:AT hook-like [Trema orientale]
MFLHPWKSSAVAPVVDKYKLRVFALLQISEPPQLPPTTTSTISTTFPDPTSFAAPITVNTIPTSGYAEVQSTVNHSVANPTSSPGVGPGHGPSPSSHHPPYAEMIYSAIGALKEKNGSSKRAIAKYIEQAYTGLPPTHSALLTHHLKRLKNNGHLVMVKKSYKLPRSDSSAAGSPTPTLPASGPQRGRGRPPKPKLDPNAQPILQPAIQPIAQPEVQPILQPAILPISQPSAQFNVHPAPQHSVQFNGQITAQPDVQPNPQPVLVALGLVDEPNPALVKKRPGRPRKAISVGVTQGGPGFIKRGRGRPPGSKGKLSGPRLSKKSPGRPRKPKSVLGVLGPKRGPGRPSKAEPKTMIIPYATNVPVVSVIDQNSIHNVLAVPPRPRGRPKKIAVTAGNAAGVGILSGKRRGRPPKVAGINKLKKSTGKRVGRPKKNALAATVATDALLAANGDLKRKLEYFQSKVKQAVGMLKPQLTHESPVTAIAAVQELEELATLDINGPIREEVQQPPQQI